MEKRRAHYPQAHLKYTSPATKPPKRRPTRRAEFLSLLRATNPTCSILPLAFAPVISFHVARSRQVLFGSMLRPEVERLNDVDLAVQLEAKEKDIDRLRAQTLLRVEESATPDFPYQFGANGGNTFSRIGSTAARLHQPQPGSSLHPISKRHIISPPSNGRGQSARVAVAAVDCAEPRRRGT